MSLLLLLAACFPRKDALHDDTALPDADTATDSGADSAFETAEPAPPEVDALSPADGTDAGGDEVVLTGRGLGGDVRVWFGATEVEVVEAGERSLVVRTPAHAPGPVAVTVARGDDEAVLDPGFTYWPDRTGLVVGVAALLYSEDLGGAGYTGVDGAYWPVVPADAELWQLFGEWDTCGGLGSLAATTWDADVWLTDQGGVPWTLAWRDDAFRGSWAASAWEGLDAMGVAGSAGDAGPAWSVEPFFGPTGAVALGSPALEDGVGAIGGGDLALTWVEGDGDFLLVQVVGATSLLCVLADDGAFTLPAASVPAVDSTALVRLTFGRYATHSAARTFDGGTVLGGAARFSTAWLTP